MTDHIAIAKKCFAENVPAPGEEGSEPERYNLYNGLVALTEALRELKEELAEVRRLVARK